MRHLLILLALAAVCAACSAPPNPAHAKADAGMQSHAPAAEPLTIHLADHVVEPMAIHLADLRFEIADCKEGHACDRGDTEVDPLRHNWPPASLRHAKLFRSATPRVWRTFHARAILHC